MMKKKTKISLPIELVTEILVKLPVESLLRFKCVCKSWFDLIKSPYFINTNLRHKEEATEEDILLVRCFYDRSSFMSCISYESGKAVSLDLHIPTFDQSILGNVCEPCHGLVCYSYKSTIVLCNPSIREFRVLPSRPNHLKFNVIALGFDSVKNDYKVIIIPYPYKAFVHKVKAQIYSMSSDSWREIDHGHNYAEYHDNNGIFFNGACHWIPKPRVGAPFILYFDMSNDVFLEMSLPDIDLPDQMRLSVLNGSLALLTSNEFGCIDIWVMHQYGISESWKKLSSFDVGPVKGLENPTPLMLWKNEVILQETWDNRIVSCALDTRKVKYFDIINKQDQNTIENQARVKIMAYRGSLVSIK